MTANLDGIFATINVYDLLPILRLANVAADSATAADKEAWSTIWNDIKGATGWEDEELAENIIESKTEGTP